MFRIQQSTTAYPLVFLMVQSADHITGLTGATVTVTLSKNGGAFASPAGAVTEIANGWYKVAGNATDSNTLGSLVLHATATSGDPTDMEFEVVSQDLTTSTLLATLSAKYGSYTGQQVFDLLVTSLLGVSSGLTLGTGALSVKAPDGTAGVVTAAIDSNGNRTTTGFAP